MKGINNKMDIIFEELETNLNNGFQIIFYYDNKKYHLFKTGDNSYTLNLLDIPSKNPLPVKQIITHKRLKEMYPFMENIEYRLGIYEQE